MKAEELMIGDWVMLDPQLKEYYEFAGKSCQVIGLSDEDGEIKIEYDEGKYFWTDGVDDIIPIPLTYEILEKNGFVPIWRELNYSKYLIYKDVVDGIHEMFIRIFFFRNKDEHKLECFDVRTGSCQLWIKYVHELQQALRLCGIRKDIII